MNKNLITLALIGLATLSTVSNAATYSIKIPLEVTAGGTGGGGGTVGNGSLPTGSIKFVTDSVVEPEEPVDENANWDIVTIKQSTGCLSEGGANPISSSYFSPIKSNTSGTTFPSDNGCGFQVVNDLRVSYRYSGSKYHDSFYNVPGSIYYTAPASITVETENGSSQCNKYDSWFKEIFSSYSPGVGHRVDFTLYYYCTSSIGASSQILKIKF